MQQSTFSAPAQTRQSLCALFLAVKEGHTETCRRAGRQAGTHCARTSPTLMLAIGGGRVVPPPPRKGASWYAVCLPRRGPFGRCRPNLFRPRATIVCRIAAVARFRSPRRTRRTGEGPPGGGARLPSPRGQAELVEGGSEIVVSHENREDYVKRRPTAASPQLLPVLVRFLSASQFVCASVCVSRRDPPVSCSALAPG